MNDESGHPPKENSKALGSIGHWARSLRTRIAETGLNVVLLGAAQRGLEERREVAKELGRQRISAIIPEDDLPFELGPSIAERDLLSGSAIDLVFVNVESWGSSAEFAGFSAHHAIVRKLVVLVPRRFHPIYGDSGGYLADAYLTHLAVFGHVHMYRIPGDDSPNWVPLPSEIIIKISSRLKQWKAISSSPVE